MSDAGKARRFGLQDRHRARIDISSSSDQVLAGWGSSDRSVGLRGPKPAPNPDRPPDDGPELLEVVDQVPIQHQAARTAVSKLGGREVRAQITDRSASVDDFY